MCWAFLMRQAATEGVPFTLYATASLRMSWAGIYPGVSNLMAAHMISIARREYNADWSYATASSSASSSSQTGQQSSSSTREAGASIGTSEREMEAAPLRSGIATMEPDEGRQRLAVSVDMH